VIPLIQKVIFIKNGINKPKYKFDFNPQTNDTIKADCKCLPLRDHSISSLMFDPPFVIGVGPSLKTKVKGRNIITNRFGSFKNYSELFSFYKNSLNEFYRILDDKAILIFKCQDVVASGKNHFSHCYILNKSYDIGFYPKDLFVLTAKNRISAFSKKKWHTQKHARKFHSYFWVFTKKRCKIDYYF